MRLAEKGRPSAAAIIVMRWTILPASPSFLLEPEVRVDERFLDKAPATHAKEEAMKKRKPKRWFPPEILSDEEVRALMDARGRYASRAVRNRALIAILYRGGLRINEALALYPKDIGLVSGAVRVLHGKGDKPRTIGIDPGAITMLQMWLERRARSGFNGVDPVFCNDDGGAISGG